MTITKRFEFILLVFSVFTFSRIEAQNSTKQSILNSVKLVADNVVKNTTYLYYDKANGELISDIQKYGYNENVVQQSGYNDWKYWNGVLHVGINALGKETGDQKYINYAKKNFEFLFKDFNYFKSIYKGDGQWSFPMAQAVDITELDDCGAIGASLVELYETDKKPEYIKYIDATADLMFNKQFRLPDGIFCRKKPLTYTVWADDLYMSVPFLARMGKMTGDVKYFDEAAKQVILFNRYLYDEKMGLIWHCYYSDTKTVGGTYWGRCNGWIMMATVNLLNYMPENHPKRNEIIALLQRQIKNIAQYQNKSGMWNQVLHKQDSYQETSCTAMFTYSIALAVRKGWVESRYKTIALAGWEGVKSQIQKDGGVTNICTGTAIGNDLKFYYDRPTPYNDIHALGAIILGGIEVSKLLQ